MASILDYPCGACKVLRRRDDGDKVKWEKGKLFSSGEYLGQGIDRNVKLLQKLTKFVELGCKRCALLHTLLRHIDSSETGVYYDFHFLEWRWSEKASKLFLDHSSYGYILYAVDESKPNEYNLPYQRDMPGNTSAESTFEKIRSWITDCNENHDKCKRFQRDGVFSPHRLLDLRDDRVRLVEGMKCHRYICLSHCWGPPEKLVRLTLSKKNEFQSDIPFDTLSKTFQEAIDVCRRLGVDFLWIDSLCIIQDSVEDWRVQSSFMADIYENAFVTIFASKARESSEGVYANYSNVDLGHQVDGLENVHIRYFRKRDMYPDSLHANASDLERWPLLTRAWVYQEQRLSKRRLHFGMNEVIWHCETRMLSEGGFTDKDGDQTPERDYTDWHKTVERYASMKMTVRSDRLVALAGIVKRMIAARPRDRYIAGLWESTLLADLLWTEDYSGLYQKPVGRTNRQLPSFSWGSVDGHISYSLGDYTLLNTVTVLEVHYVPSGPVELGNPAEAYIKIKSPIFEATLIPIGSEGSGDYDLQPAESYEGKGKKGRRRAEKYNRLLGDISFLPDNELETVGGFIEPCSNVAVLFLLIDGSCQLKGLVLRKRGDGKYLRVGTFFMSYTEEQEVLEKFLARQSPTITLI